MIYDFNIIAFPGDKVWIAFEGGPYRVEIVRVETILSFSNPDEVYGHILYHYKMGNGLKYHAYGQAVFLNREEAEQRVKLYENANEKERSRLIVASAFDHGYYLAKRIKDESKI